MFAYASNASLSHTSMEQDAINALEERVRNNALIAIFTNSSPEKARDMLTRAGFGSRIINDSVEAGKIGAIGYGKKWWVDTSLPTDNVDLSRYFKPDQINLDLRRGEYKKKVDALMAHTGANKVAMFTDIPELDSYPLRAWYGDRALLGMKTNPVSAEESIHAASEILNMEISNKLSVLMELVLQRDFMES